MTWIVGAPTMWGTACAFRCSGHALERHRDRLSSKDLPVGQFIAAGFAGSVRIGFAMVETLQQLLYTGDSSRAWDPIAVSEWWPEDARRVFGQFSVEEQALQTHLMLISTHPTEPTDTPWPRAFVHLFRSPDFLPGPIAVHKLGAIGSGNGIAQCKAEIERLSNDHDAMFSIEKGEQGVHGGMGTRLGFNLTTILKRVQPNGVSSHLHYCWVYRGEIIIKANDHASKGAWTAFESGSGYGRHRSDNPPPATSNQNDEGWSVFAMPTIASSWDQLVSLIEATQASATSCVA